MMLADDEEQDDELQDLDSGLFGQTTPQGTGFQLGMRRLQPETSLMLFVRRRAKSTYVGYVDATTLSAAMLPSNRGIRILNAVVSPAVPDGSQFLQGSLSQQLEYLNHFSHGSTARRLLLTETLPHHDYDRNLPAIADCLLAPNQAVRRDAVSRLERLMIITNYSTIHAVKTQLLAVAQKTRDVIVDPVEEDNVVDVQHLQMCVHLHLLAMAALLCRAKHRPTLDECRPFMTWPKASGKKAGSEAGQDVLRELLAFYEQLERLLVKEQKGKTAGGAGAGSGGSAIGDKSKFQKASFCEQFTAIFFAFNQVAEQGWSERGRDHLLDLKDMLEVMVKEGKRWKPEVKAALDVLMARSLVVILNTVYAKVRQQVGEEAYDQATLAAQMLANLVKSLGPALNPLRDHLLPHLSTAAFHESPEVRREVLEVLDSAGHSPLHAALDHLEAVLSVADFHVPRASGSGGGGAGGSGGGGDRKVGTLERRGAVKTKRTPSCEGGTEAFPLTCGWHSLRGRFGQDLSTDCALLVHVGSCEARMWAGKPCQARCRSEAEGESCPGDEWYRHTQSLELLAKLSPNNFLLQLFAFQLAPFFFYATESLKGNRLLEHLINHRAAQRWLSPATLCRLAHDVVSALQFLVVHHLASRELTAYDLLVTGRSRRGGRAGEMIDVLMTEDFSVRLISLGLAHQYKDEDDVSIIPEPSFVAVPLLWTPVEGLVKGKYGERSMVYSLGGVLYELWTHGCQPFTTYQTSTADTIRMMILKPGSVPLIHWPCIPDVVYNVMKRCTSSQPDQRPSLKELKQTFMELHSKYKQEGEKRRLDLEGKKELSYPAFCDDQVARKHVPERGLPPEIRQIINERRRNQPDAYRNMRQSRWEEYNVQAPQVDRSELNALLWVDVKYMEKCTSVHEMLTSVFAENELPLLISMATYKESSIVGLTDWTEERIRPLEESTDYCIHERKYPPSWTLLDTVCKALLGSSESGYIIMGVDRYTHVLLALARGLHALHVAGWLHRDIRAASVLIDCQTGQTTLLRLGRMCQVSSANNYFVSEVFDDTYRWLAPEVLSEGKYSRASDVFMLGTVFWEVFWAREVTEKDPTATEINYAPFAGRRKAEILSLVQSGERLPKPVLCPDWLYQLSVKCRDPDPQRRPSIEGVIQALEAEYKEIVAPNRGFLPHPKLLGEVLATSRADTGEHLPPLPSRHRWRSGRVPPHSSSADEDEESGQYVGYGRGTGGGQLESQSAFTNGAYSRTSSYLTSLSDVRLDVDAPRRSSGEYSDAVSELEQEASAGTGSTREADNSGYLTPLSREVQTTLQARRARQVRERPGSDWDPPPIPSRPRLTSEGGANKTPASTTSLSDPALPEGQAGRAGLTHGQREGSEVLTGGRLFKKVPQGSLPGPRSVSFKEPGPSRTERTGPERSLSLPPLQEDDSQVYCEISDKSSRA